MRMYVLTRLEAVGFMRKDIIIYSNELAKNTTCFDMIYALLSMFRSSFICLIYPDFIYESVLEVVQ